MNSFKAWNNKCAYMGCHKPPTHDRWTASGDTVEYCRAHFEEAGVWFGPPRTSARVLSDVERFEIGESL